MQNAVTFSKFFLSDDMQVILCSYNLDSKDAAECFRHINTIEELDMPPDKDFYLFVAKANRIFGRKDEALAAYKKVLELS